MKFYSGESWSYGSVDSESKPKHDLTEDEPWSWNNSIKSDAFISEPYFSREDETYTRAGFVAKIDPWSEFYHFVLNSFPFDANVIFYQQLEGDAEPTVNEYVTPVMVKRASDAWMDSHYDSFDSKEYSATCLA